MTPQQWSAHEGHWEGHVMWPASKAEIVAACNGMADVDDGIKKEVEAIPNRNYSSAADLKAVLM